MTPIVSQEKDSISKLHASDSPQLQINNISPKPTVDGRLYGQGRVADLTLKPQIVSMSPAKAMALKHREGAGAKGAMAW